MIELTTEEIQKHAQTLRKMRRQVEQVKTKFVEGDITLKKYKQAKKALDVELEEYIRESGVFMFYGRLFKKVIQ